MHRRRRTSYALIATSLAFVVGCSVSPEKKILQDFFRASRLRDDVTLGNFATATFDPHTDGIVQSFDVVTIGEEKTAPFSLKTLAKAAEDAKTANTTFTTEKRAYQNEHLDAIKRVIKAAEDGKAVAAKDRAIKAEWDKWTADAATHLKTVSDTQQQLSDERGVPELSLSRPNGPTVDATNFDGVMVSKEIVVNATVRDPSGQTSTKKLVAVLERPQVKDESGKELVGRWIVTSVKTAS